MKVALIPDLQPLLADIVTIVARAGIASEDEIVRQAEKDQPQVIMAIRALVTGKDPPLEVVCGGGRQTCYRIRREPPVKRPRSSAKEDDFKIG